MKKTIDKFISLDTKIITSKEKSIGAKWMQSILFKLVLKNKCFMKNLKREFKGFQYKEMMR
jgi:hypothetical protein